MLRQVKPKNARSKRALAAREPKHVENPKSALFLRGTTCSQIVQDALADLFALRQPLSKKFTKKNSIRPFEDAASLEFLSSKNDTALSLFGSSSKKRPHTITITRTFSHKVLDMLELYLDQESLRTLKQFKGRKPNVGQRPMILFAGTAFESPVADEYTLAKSMFTDIFRCDGGSSADSGQLDVEALQHIISITCSDPPSPDQKPVLRLRCYAIVTKRSGQKLPRIELEEMGPRMDFRVGRSRQADEAMLKEALKKGKTTEAREKKNVSMDVMGDKMGRIHLGRQDLSEMSLRRYKGLKRGRGGDGDAGAAEEDEVETPKKRKT